MEMRELINGTRCRTLEGKVQITTLGGMVESKDIAD